MSIHYISPGVLKKFRGKTCLLRVDLNIERDEEKDSFRLEAILPTARLLLKQGIKVVILSHRGRPRLRDRRLSLRPFASILEKKLKQRVVFMTALPRGIVLPTDKIVLLENLRFWRGEEENDLRFAKSLARLGDFYVNDAFAVSHRKNASVVAITKYLSSYGGFLFQKELKNLSAVIQKSKKPFTVIIGGAKASDKLGVIKNLWKKTDYFLLGGGPANTFFAAQGLPVGESLYDKESVAKVKRFLKSKKIILPVDVKLKNRQILDIGDRTISKYSNVLKNSRTIIWNGPMGFFEKKEFAKGTEGIWRAILRNKRAKIIVGGGETTASLNLITNYQLLITKNKNLFVSTGGGAMLEYLSGKKLAGIEALK